MATAGTLRDLATALATGEDRVAAASQNMADAADRGDAGDMAAEIPNLTTGLAMMQMASSQQSVVSSKFTGVAEGLGGAGR
jgi:HAMP domain-containing protein